MSEEKRPLRKRDFNAAFQRYALKIRVLQHYGKGGRVQCCWRGCDVRDPDLLTIDHENGITQIDRQASGRRRAGSSMHKWLEARRYPKGYQTLCYNHQMAKELRLRRE